MKNFNYIRMILIFLIFLSLNSAVFANPLIHQKKIATISTPLFSNIMPQILIDIQNNLRNTITNIFKNIQIKGDPISYAILIFITFLYGILHAAGPGHRKTIVFSAFITKKSHFMEPAMVGLLVAALHTLTSLLLILALYFLLHGMHSGWLTNAGQITEIVSFLLLAVFVGVLLVIKIYKIFKKSSHHHNKSLFQGKGFYSSIIVSGIAPCPGITIVMIFAIYLSMVWQGILAALAMSLGMGFTISLAGYLAFFSKEAIFKTFKNKERHIEIISDTLEIGGLSFILFVSMYMLIPFFRLITKF